MAQSFSPSRSKTELRNALRQRRKDLDPVERQALSEAAAGCLASSLPWQTARTVALYIAVQGELDTTVLLENAWANGKTVLLPVPSRKSPGRMHFAPCSGMDALRPGLFGIPEPAGADADSLSEDCACAPDLIVIPALAFDPAGTRLGMGGGYYDRLLALPRYQHCLRVGLIYAFQFVACLPKEAWDLPTHAVCTEQGFVWIQPTDHSRTP